MPPVKGKMWAYTEKQMINAIADVRKGTPASTAAKRHGVPRVSLLYKVKGKTPIYRKMGPSPVIPKDVEEQLVQWIISVAKAGFPVTAKQVVDCVQKLVTDMNIDNNFTEGRPGRKWLQGFMKRNPTISVRTAENLTASRASVTKQYLLRWYTDVHHYLKKENYADILDEPSCVYNADETAFFLNPKGSKVLAQKGTKSVYFHVNSNDKECLTVLITASASGMLCPPLVVFKYERIPKCLADSVPTEWGIGKSESGWMTGALFYEYIGNVFYPWLVNNNITLPVILFLDGHTSHMTLHLSNLCREKGIILVALPPNTTHLTQPMDVAVFRTLKENWKIKVHAWRVQNMENPTLQKKDFSGLLKQVLDDNITPSIIANGFRKCGLVPWNPDAIKIIGDSLNENDAGATEEPISPALVRLQCGLSVVEETIGNNKLKLFRDSTEWTGSVEDTSLFHLWQELRDNIKLLKNPQSSDKSSELSAERYDSCKYPTQGSHGIAEINEASITDAVSDNQQHSLAEMETENGAETGLMTNSPGPSGLSKNSGLSILPITFKKALLWPEKRESPRLGKRQKEMLPNVITSDLWQEYHKQKQEKKIKAEQQKKEKAAARQKKKQENEKLKQARAVKKDKKPTRKPRRGLKPKNFSWTSSSSTHQNEWVPSDSSVDDVLLVSDGNMTEEED